MPRKRCFRKCWWMYCGTDENITVFNFSTDNDECDKWI